MGKIIHVSVSGILKRKNKVFVVKRSLKQRYFPGYWCFPGGKLSSKDGQDDNRFHRALVREIKEELDIDISKFKCRKIDITTTPEFAPYRFENHFFLIDLNDEKDLRITLDEEHTEADWIDLNQVASFFKKPGRLTIPPIPFYLNAMSKNEGLTYNSQYLDRDQEILVAQYLPGIILYVVPSKALPPSKHTNVLLIGEQDKVLVDPSPRNQEHINLLVNEFKDKLIKKIFISHWHLDHHEHATIFSKKLQAPLVMSKSTLDIIYEQWGSEYFKDVDIELIEAGNVINLSGVKLLVRAHSGHAKGQLGLEAADGSWVFLSDVFQGIGSVVVEDMNDYIECLQDLISYPDETVFIPSHGFPIGGKSQLQKLLAHRLDRENQVEIYLREGLSEDKIFEKIYPNLDNAMKRFAIKNIRGHIERIKNH